jgi:hypothetical protein
MAFYIILKDQNDSQKFVRELNRSDSINQIQLYFNEEQF